MDWQLTVEVKIQKNVFSQESKENDRFFEENIINTYKINKKKNLISDKIQIFTSFFNFK